MLHRPSSRAICGLVLGLAGTAFAQDSSGDLDAAVRETIDRVVPGTVTVTATRTSRDPFELPQSIRIVDAEEIRDSGGSFVAFRALSRRDAGIWYDERSSSTVDPMIRGFAGFNLLTLVDGNTLSTLWGEGGFGADDMYGKLDPEMVERIEVIRGPGSALYGSNALGAVINVITRSSRYDYTDGDTVTGWRTTMGYGSAANAGSFRLENHGATDSLRWMIGGSARSFDHIDGGGHLGELDPSDGDERNWDFSGEYRLDDDRTVRLTVQDVHRYGTTRYYRPTQDNTNDREAIALSYRDDRGSDIYDSLEARLYWQHKADERRFFDTNTRGVATTDTWQANVTGTRDLGDGHVLTAGFAFEWDAGDSPDDEQFTFTYPGPKRRDAPLSDWRDYAVYLQDEWQVADAWSLIGSARYDRMIFSTDVDRAYSPPAGDPRADDIRDAVGSVTGGLGAVHRVDDNLRLSANWARGFRQNAPNFGIRQLGDGVLVPNDLLDPTTSDNFELGLKGRYPGWTFELAYYRSLIDNWQGDLRQTTYGGRSFFDFNRNGTRDSNEGFVKQVEGGKAWVQGVEANVSAELRTFFPDVSPNWSVWSSFAWNEGRVDATREHPIREPLRHTQPMRCLVGVRWDDKSAPETGFFWELVADMVSGYDEIPSDRIASDLAWRENPQDGTSPMIRSDGGVPGYTLLHLSAGMNLSESTRVTFGVENLADKQYRVAHSRMDAPGINFIAGLEIDF